MEGQAANSTINRARSAKQLEGLLKRSICLGLGHRTVTSVRLQPGRCLWAFNEIRAWVFCCAFLWHKTYYWSQWWSHDSGCPHVAWRSLHSRVVGLSIAAHSCSGVWSPGITKHPSLQQQPEAFLYGKAVPFSSTNDKNPPIKAQCEHLVISLLSKTSAP